MTSQTAATQYPTVRRVVLTADLSGFHRAFRGHSDSEMAHFLDRFYSLCQEVTDEHGGLVIKFIGDAMLAVFGEDEAQAAVATAVVLGRSSRELAEAHDMDFVLGSNIHTGPVVLAELGGGGSRRVDVIGLTVNRCFLLGRGPGIRISEPVYRKLPSGDRSPWDKHKPPAVYTLGRLDAEPYAHLGRSPDKISLDW